MEYIKKEYGYKVLDAQGCKLGKVEYTPGYSPTFCATKSCTVVSTYEMRQIAAFMESLECQKHI